MPRAAKPFKYRGNWVSKIAGRLTILAKIAPEDTGKNAPDHVLALLLKMRQEASQTPSEGSTMAEAFPRYLALTGKAESSQKNVKSQLRLLLAEYGHLPMSKITPLLAGQWQAKINHEKGSTYEGKRAAVIAFWNWAIKQGITTSNPFKTLPSKQQTQRERVATKSELQAILRQARRAEDRQVILFLRLTGCRPQDLLSRWEWLDGQTIRIPAAHHKTGRKTNKERVIYLPKPVVKLLAWRKARTKSARIFDTHLQLFRDRWRTMLRHAGIVADSNGEKLCCYSLRHTRLTELGVSAPSAIVQKVAGHASPVMTARYIHPDDESVLSFLAK